MYEDLLYDLEIRTRIKKHIQQFFDDSIKSTGQEQLFAIGNFHLMQLAEIFPHNKNCDFAFTKIKEHLNNLFEKENDVNYLGLKIDNLNLVLRANYGSDVIANIRKEQISFLLSLTLSERFPNLSKTLYFNNMKGWFKRFSAKRKYKKQLKFYRAQINELYTTYPCLWLIPFISVMMDEHISSS